MIRNRVNILGCGVDRISMADAITRVTDMIASGQFHQVITLNAEIIYQAVNNTALRQMINEAELVTPDGAGVVWAARYLESPVKERVTGIDLVEQLARHGAAVGWKFFFLGAAPGVTQQAASKLVGRYPELQVVGTDHGYFTPDDEPALISAINRSGANILLVGLGAPRQDFWIAQQGRELQCQVAIGVGGSFDVLAENLTRAPKWMIKANLEWLYRLAKEPTRWRRQLALPRFVQLVLKAGKQL